MNEQNLMKISQAAKKLNIKYPTLRAAFKRGAIDGDRVRNLVDFNSAQSYFSVKEKVAFSDLSLDFDEVLRPLDFISQNFFNQPQRIITPNNYFVSSKGQVYSSTYNRTLTPSLASHGYLQVKLNDVSMRVHTLVALGFCPNRLGKTDVHHIDGDNQNNHATNLIWLTKKQHIEAHKLMNQQDKTEYKKFISAMKKENKWDGEYRPIVLEKPDKTMFAWIKKDVWQEYQEGLRTLNDIYYYDVGAEKTVYKEVFENESRVHSD